MCLLQSGLCIRRHFALEPRPRKASRITSTAFLMHTGQSSRQFQKVAFGRDYRGRSFGQHRSHELESGSERPPQVWATSWQCHLPLVGIHKKEGRGGGLLPREKRESEREREENRMPNRRPVSYTLVAESKSFRSWVAASDYALKKHLEAGGCRWWVFFLPIPSLPFDCARTHLTMTFSSMSMALRRSRLAGLLLSCLALKVWGSWV